MEKEQHRRKEIALGQQAERELSLISDIAAQYRARCLQEIIESKAEEVLRRERLIVTVQTIDTVVRSLKKAIGAKTAIEMQDAFEFPRDH